MVNDVEFKGPFFHPGHAPFIKRALDKAEEAVGEATKREVDARLGAVLRNPTGRYQHAIRLSRRPDGMQISDGGVVYGPWLEGTGSRNQTSRFKGYATMRKVTAVMQGRAARIAEPIIAREIRGLQ